MMRYELCIIIIIIIKYDLDRWTGYFFNHRRIRELGHCKPNFPLEGMYFTFNV